MARPDFMIKSVPRTRLDVAKFVISDFIEKRKGDRVGLIAFGTRPFLISPPTYDIKTLSRLLSETKIGMAGSKTSIGDAIAKAVKTLENTKSNSRVLILLSDGANRIGNIGIDEAIRVAKSINLKIYAIAIGAKNMKEILPNGKVRYTKSSDLNIDILKKIANQTGGKLYIANSTNNLKLNYDKINKLEPIDDKEIYLKPQKELFYIPLLGVLLVLFLYFARVLISKFRNNNKGEDNV
jgi:Ca-activated chloride channel family protein